MADKDKPRLTSIQVTQEFKDFLQALGKKGQSYEDIIKENLKKH